VKPVTRETARPGFDVEQSQDLGVNNQSFITDAYAPHIDYPAGLPLVKPITEIVYRNRGGGDEVSGRDEERRREDED
jgi:hypothetical protein